VRLGEHSDPTDSAVTDKPLPAEYVGTKLGKMKNNKLTLKALKAELDLIKASKGKGVAATKEGTGQDIRHSYINNLNMRLRENSMFLLYILSGILAYAHKIPFIGRIISLLSIWYYPFTEINPYDSYFNRLRISWLVA